MPEQQPQPKEEGPVTRFFSAVVFWWLTTMAVITLALAALVPSWVEYRQVVQVREQVAQQVAQLQKQADRNTYFIQSYHSDPEALDLLAISDLRYRRPDEAPMPLPPRIVSNFRAAAYSPILTNKPAAPASQPTGSTSRIEGYVERAQALCVEHLGTRRAIGLVEMFCDKTTRTGLTAAALAVLAAALFLCRAPASTKD